MKKIMLYAFLVITISCSKDNQVEKFAKNFNQKLNLKSIRLMHNDNLLGDPTDIRIVDSTLLFLDPDGQYHVKAVNINNLSQCNHFLIKGRGPNEFGSVRSININQNNEICFLDDNTLTYYEIPFDFTEKPVAPCYQKKLSIDFGRVIFTAGINGVNISTGVFKTDGRFLLSNGTNEEENILIGQYPKDNLPESSNLIRGMAYQTFLKLGKSNNLIVAYSFRAGCITFFNIENNVAKIKKEHTFYIPKYTPDTDQGIGVRYDPESMVCFIDVCCANDYVFALFSGRSVKDFKTNAYLGNKIFVFSKEGVPVAEINLDIDIRCFDIDKQTSIIYGVTLTPFPKIVTFSLDGVLN